MWRYRTVNLPKSEIHNWSLLKARIHNLKTTNQTKKTLQKCGKAQNVSEKQEKQVLENNLPVHGKKYRFQNIATLNSNLFLIKINKHYSVILCLGPLLLCFENLLKRCLYPLFPFVLSHVCSRSIDCQTFSLVCWTSVSLDFSLCAYLSPLRPAFWESCFLSLNPRPYWWENLFTGTIL